ncbi:MAG: T9SS type A sorting domain-containing protein [Calditrichaeota bacterium]|nr:T9SS type A sorting domain-containing protein [Calditrichota bacterium]
MHRIGLASLIFSLALALSAPAQVFTDIAPDLGLDIITPFGDVFPVDFNGDDHNDLIYTSRYDAPSYYFQYANGEYHLLPIGLPLDECDPWKVIPVDFDHDGDLDLFMCAYHYRSPYYENIGGQLVDHTAEMGLTTRTGGRDIAVADLNHDGWMDIISAYYDIGWKVYLNDNGESFVDVTSASGLPMISQFHRFCEADVDLDGNTDLFMTTLGGNDHFFVNNNGEFADYTEQSGLSQARGHTGCVWADFDNDKYPDLLTGGEGEHTIWHNNGNRTFTEMNVHGMDVIFDVYCYGATYAVGDYDLDGDLDIYAGQPDGGWWGLKPNQFFRCDSIVGLDAYFTDIAPELEMSFEEDTKPVFYDFDRDGDLDLFLRTYGIPSKLYRNNMNAGAATRVRVEGPAGERDCWLTRVEVYEHGTENLVVCGETNYAGARRDGMCHVFTLDQNTAYDLRIHFANGDEMTPVSYPELAGITPAEFDNLIIVRRGVGVFGSTDAREPVEIPQSFTVSAYPNPFNAVATISLNLPETSDVSAEIFNIAGQHVATLVNEKLASGSHTYSWDAGEFGTGVYILHVATPTLTSSSKLLLLK